MTELKMESCEAVIAHQLPEGACAPISDIQP